MSRMEGSPLLINHGGSRDRYKARRTKAMPKHTLFGAGLELLDQEQREHMRQIDGRRYELEEIEAKRKPQKVLPQAYRVHLPDSRYLTDNAAALHVNRQTARAAKLNLETLEKQCRYNFGANSTQQPPQTKSANPNQSSQWITRRDLDHTDEINKVGLNNRSYNHDKYGRRPPVHQYSMIGSILQPGMDFNEVEKEQFRGPYKKPEIRRNPDWLRREDYIKHHSGEKSPQPQVLDLAGLKIPRNIQHKFGTKLCQSLLSDKNLVDKTVEHQRKVQDTTARRNRHIHSSPLEVTTDPDLDPTYDDLGATLRCNMFPGQTYDHKVGVIKGDFNDDVHKNRVPNPDQWRYQRDHLSIWNEHRVLYERMKRKLQEYEESLPKATVNWDRNAKREKPKPEPKTSKPKAKPKTRKDAKINGKGAGESDIVFEDVEFVTPPLTPPPPPQRPPVAKMPGYMEDDDFWDFYNDPLPLP